MPGRLLPPANLTKHTPVFLLAEFRNGQAPALEALFNTPPWRVVEVISDLSRRPRHLHAVTAG